MDSVQIKLYDLFRKELNLPDDKAAAFVAAVEGVVEHEFKHERQALSTKDDIRFLREDLKNDLHSVELKIEQSKGNMYKAMFVSGLVQLVAISGGVLSIVKNMR